MSMYYTAVCKTKKELKHHKIASDNEEHVEYDGISENDKFNGQVSTVKYPFNKRHPGYHVCHLAKLKRWVAPKIYTTKGYFCRINHIELHGETETMDTDSEDCQEQYAKPTCIMFYPCSSSNYLKKKRQLLETISSQNSGYKDLQFYRTLRIGIPWMRMLLEEYKYKLSQKRIKVETPKLSKTGRCNRNKEKFDFDDTLDICNRNR